MHSSMLTTSGTTDPQPFTGNFSTWVAVNGTVAMSYVEPQLCVSQGNEGHQLDAISRLLIFSTRLAGTGTWNATLSIRREATLPNTNISFVIPLKPENPLSLALNSPLPEDCAKEITGGGEAIDDELYGQVTVVPGQDVVATCFVLAMLVPGFKNVGGDRGANLSHRPFLSDQ